MTSVFRVPFPVLGLMAALLLALPAQAQQSDPDSSVAPTDSSAAPVPILSIRMPSAIACGIAAAKCRRCCS